MFYVFNSAQNESPAFRNRGKKKKKIKKQKILGENNILLTFNIFAK